jgi:hypothetical protein
LKDVEGKTWEDCYSGLKVKISNVFEQHREVMDRLTQNEKQFYNSILSRTADEVDFGNALGNLSRWIDAYYGEKVILLIDEYDAPINDGYIHGYSEDVIRFIRNMFGYAMKTNPSLHKAILTGLTKIAGQSLFSKLNNFISYNVMKKEFSQYFGFTQEDVEYAVSRCSVGHSLKEISDWYNGYNFGGTNPIYSPWSIMNVCAFPDQILKSYWINTSSDGALGQFLNNLSIPMKEKLYELANGKSFELPLKDDVTYENLKVQNDVLWSFLLYAGYLTAKEPTRNTAVFYVPNFEVREALLSTMSRWVVDQSGGTEDVNIMLSSMLRGDCELFEEKLADFVYNSFSFFDATDKKPEIVYHAFVLGLLAHVQNGYYFNSNPVTGRGRSDVLIMPKSGKLATNAVILEFKQTNDIDKLETTAKEGLSQIKRKKYIDEAFKRGSTVIYAYGIGFCGRDVMIEMEKIWVK